MTQAALATTRIHNPNSYSNSMVARGGQSVRSMLASARPIMPDDLSRRTKFLTAKNIWKECHLISGSVAETYLTGIGWMPDTVMPNDIRFHPALLFEPTRERLPAMVSAVRNRDGMFVGIHRTFLADDGSMLVKPDGARRMLGHCHGGFVQLAEATAFRLIVTETIEMALLIRQACPDLPVWAAMTIGNMKSPVPANVREVILCIDGIQNKPEVASKLLMDAAREHMGRGTTVLMAEPMSRRRNGGVLS